MNAHRTIALAALTVTTLTTWTTTADAAPVRTRARTVRTVTGGTAAPERVTVAAPPTVTVRPA